MPVNRGRGLVPLEVAGIDPVRIGVLRGGFGRIARWEVTCGSCRARFRGGLLELPWGTRLSWIGCPTCGTHNLLPHHPSMRRGR